MRSSIPLFFSLALTSMMVAQAADTPGVTATKLTVGGVMPLEGENQGLGTNVKAGVEAALQGQKVQTRNVEFVARNDFYDPKFAVTATNELVKQGIFAMVGNVGTPTAKATLPILAENKIPAVGFFTGAGLLRPGKGEIINFRASYVQETAAVISAALRAGIKPTEICAYVQNDAYGMAGVAGIKLALGKDPGAASVLQAIEQVQAVSDESPQRNAMQSPIGFYQRNTLRSREGYLALKNWEKTASTRCRLVVTVGVYTPISNFIAYSRDKGETWLISAVSFTGADSFKEELKKYQAQARVVMTQVVPSPARSNLPIVVDARRALGNRLNYVSLEGYIVGRMFLAIAQSIKGELTPANFTAAARGQRFDLGGLSLDFTSDNQGSDLVQMTVIEAGDYVEIGAEQIKQLLQTTGASLAPQNASLLSLLH
jgi:ABC-type branched-subunit amino acid transport system substrate-binding protein